MQQIRQSYSEVHSLLWSSSQRLLQRGQGQLQTIWNLYVNVVHGHRHQIVLLDTLLERYCSWCWCLLPPSTNTAPGAASSSLKPSQQPPQPQKQPSWMARLSYNTRSVLWALLQLHRLALDLALTTQPLAHSSHNNKNTNIKNNQIHSHSALEYGHDNDRGPLLVSTSFVLSLALSMMQSLWPLTSSPTTMTTASSSATIDDHIHNTMGEHTVSCRHRRRRLWLERVKFFLRSGLLMDLWRRRRRYYSYYYRGQQRQRQHDDSVPELLPAGGRLLLPPPHLALPSSGRSSWEPSRGFSQQNQHEQQQQEEERERRYHAYVGRRTGHRLWFPPEFENGGGSCPYPCSNGVAAAAVASGQERHRCRLQLQIQQWLGLSLLAIGEILYIVRPLFWAEAQVAIDQDNGGSGSSKPNQGPASSNKHDHNNNDKTRRLYQAWKTWFQSLGLDVASLVVLLVAKAIAARRPPIHHHRNNTTAGTNNTNRNDKDHENDNYYSEWNRRRLRLWLYLLRSPVWELVTHPMVTGFTSALEQYLPVLGPWFSAYGQDWIWLWKEYRLEEG
ncbi:hypothetical protein ACA910_019855 [Epithemia clementina (nom. ined.)]